MDDDGGQGRGGWIYFYKEWAQPTLIFILLSPSLPTLAHVPPVADDPKPIIIYDLSSSSSSGPKTTFKFKDLP